MINIPTNNFNAILVTDTSDYPNWQRGYGAHRLATHLRVNGYSVLVIDFSSALNINIWEEIIKVSIGPDTKFVGFSTCWWPYRKKTGNKLPIPGSVRKLADVKSVDDPTIEQYNTLTDLAYIGQAKIYIDIVKKYNSKTKILLGGVKIDWYTDFPADHVMSGYSEVQILDFLQQPNRIWNKLINHDTSAESKNWGWVESFTGYTKYDQIRSNELMTLEVARGCRFACLFCAWPLIGKKDIAKYIKGSDALYKELLDNYTKWGITDYWIADDTLNDSTEKLQYMAAVVKLLPFKPKFRCYLRIDLIVTHPEQAQLLLDIGIVGVFVGIETFHPKSAKVIGKGMDSEKRKQALRYLQNVWEDQIRIECGYIIGLPHESYTDMRDSHAWFMQPDCPVHCVYYFPLIITPPALYPNKPSSELEKSYEKYGYTISEENMHAGKWTKNDDSDIKSFEQSFEIMQELNAEIATKNTMYRKPSFQWSRHQADPYIITDPLVEYFPQLLTMLEADAKIIKVNTI